MKNPRIISLVVIAILLSLMATANEMAGKDSGDTLAIAKNDLMKIFMSMAKRSLSANRVSYGGKMIIALNGMSISPAN